MESSTAGLVLASDASIDLQLHTIYSDGNWQPDQLIDYLIKEGFALGAITDHDRAGCRCDSAKAGESQKFPAAGRR